MCCFLKNSWGWLVTFSTFLLILPVTGILSSFGVIFVKLQLEYEISDFALGWIGSVAFGIMFAASPLSTGLFKRFGHRKVAVVGVIMCSAGLLLSAAVPHPYYLFATYSLLFGIGSNFIDNTTLNLVGTYFPRKNSARASCFATLGWSVGSLALNPAIEILCEKFGWRKTFIILGCCLFVEGLICASVFRKKSNYVEVPLPDETESDEFYDDEEIDRANEVFKSADGYAPVVTNGKVCEPALSTQLETINESALSNENVNQNCHKETVTRKESVKFAPTTQLPGDEVSGRDQEEKRKDGDVSKEEISRRDSSLSRKDSTGGRLKRGSGSTRRDSTKGRRDSTGKGGRRSSSMSRRDSIVGFIRRDSAWSRRESTRSLRIPVPEPKTKHTTKEYLKAFLHTFRAPGILLWILANVLMNMSLVFPFVNFIKFMETIGIPSSKGVHVLMVFGVCDLIGRGSSALFGDYIPFHTVYVYPIANLIMGSVTMTLLVITTIGGLYGYAVVVGVLTGVVNSMLLKVCMDLFGHKLLAESWTLTLLAAGIGITFGPSVAGASYDLTQSFDVAFYIGGGIYIVASFVTLLIPFVQRRKKWIPEKESKPTIAHIEGFEDILRDNGYNPSLIKKGSFASSSNTPSTSSAENATEATVVEQKLTVV